MGEGLQVVMSKDKKYIICIPKNFINTYDIYLTYIVLMY